MDLTLPDELRRMQDVVRELGRLRLRGAEAELDRHLHPVDAYRTRTYRHALATLQGGRPIAEHQTVALKLFDAFRSIEAARVTIDEGSDAEASLARRHGRIGAARGVPEAVHAMRELVAG